MTDRKLDFTRRDLLRGAVGATVGSALTLQGFPCAAPTSSPDPANLSLVVLVRDSQALDESHRVVSETLGRMMDELLVRLTGKTTPLEAWRQLARPSDIVGLVPTDHLNPTHEEIVDLVKERLISAGVPKDNIRNAQGRSGRVAECTALIALPALKAHWLTGIGTVIKNYIMFSGSPSRYHDADSANLGEIWLRPEVKGKTRLILVDALRPLCDKGPQVDPRYLWDYKGLVAGFDPVAVDTVCLKILTEKRQLLRGEPWPLSPPPICVAAADERFHLGTSRWEKIRLEKGGWSEGRLV